MNPALQDLIKNYFHSQTFDYQLLSPAGSNRRYYRAVCEGCSIIAVEGTSQTENRAFIDMAQRFFRSGLNVPQLYAHTADFMCYIQQDLGDELLFNHLDDESLLQQTIRLLAHFQKVADSVIDYSVCYPQPQFNRRSVLWDLNYWKYCFLKPSGIDFEEDRLEDDFEHLADRLTAVREQAFMYRDFQSRNVMISDGKPFFIDFQGGRRGPIYYDLASFLWQAKAGFSPEQRLSLINIYKAEWGSALPADFDDTLRYFVLFRTLQVLGAYGYRGWFEHKPHFIQSIPHAIANLRELLRQDFTDYPYLVEVLHRLVMQLQITDPYPQDQTTVTIYSFSYKRGIPEDKSNNGGGFVFDCRAIHNPGKYEQYKHLTGLDQPVIDFLEQDGEILRFLDNVYQLVDAAVERYLARGFSHLQVAFGCTGGQHRSAYSAQHLAMHLKDRYPVNIELIHRELQQ